MTERQKDRKTERQIDRKTERKKDSKLKPSQTSVQALLFLPSDNPSSVSILDFKF
jgi:hypothetical protein